MELLAVILAPLAVGRNVLDLLAVAGQLLLHPGQGIGQPLGIAAQAIDIHALVVERTGIHGAGDIASTTAPAATGKAGIGLLGFILYPFKSCPHRIGGPFGPSGSLVKTITNGRDCLLGIATPPFHLGHGIGSDGHGAGQRIPGDLALGGQLLLPRDHCIDLGGGLGAVVGGSQSLLDGGATGTRVRHQYIQGADGLLKARTDTTISPFEVQPQLLKRLGQLSRAIGGGLLGHRIDLGQIITGPLGLITQRFNGCGALSPAPSGLVVMHLALCDQAIEIRHAGDGNTELR